MKASTGKRNYSLCAPAAIIRSSEAAASARERESSILVNAYRWYRLSSVHPFDALGERRRRRARGINELSWRPAAKCNAFLVNGGDGGGGDVAGSSSRRRVGSNGAFASDLLRVPRPSRIDSRTKIVPRAIIVRSSLPPVTTSSANVCVSKIAANHILEAVGREGWKRICRVSVDFSSHQASFATVG